MATRRYSPQDTGRARRNRVHTEEDAQFYQYGRGTEERHTPTPNPPLCDQGGRLPSPALADDWPDAVSELGRDRRHRDDLVGVLVDHGAGVVGPGLDAVDTVRS